MRKIILASTLALAAVAGAANAASPSVPTGPGDVQLALAAGVTPGQYSRAEILGILEAKRENDAQKLEYYLSGANRGASTVAPSALAQLEGAAGVRGGNFTVAELQRLREARSENDAQAVDFILSRAAKAPAEASVVTPGEAMLAAVIGVDPAAYTLAELVAMQPEAD